MKASGAVVMYVRLYNLRFHRIYCRRTVDYVEINDNITIFMKNMLVFVLNQRSNCTK